MKVLFVFVDGGCGYGVPKYPSLAFALLSRVLKEKGHEVEVMDQRIDARDIQGVIDSFIPDFIGFHITVLNLETTNNLLRALKLPKNCLTIAGGPHPSFCPQEFGAFDYIVVGEGENAILDVVEGRAQTGVVQVPVANINVVPDWSVYKDYKFKHLPLFITRGCPYSCIFCSVNKIFGKKHRKRDLKNVYEEIKQGMAMGVKYFDIIDDNFTMDKHYVQEFCKMVKPLNIRWDPAQGVRIDRLDYETMRMMHDSGCRMMGVGIESGVQRVVNNIGKSLDLEEVKERIKDAHRAGIKVKGFFVVGSSGETYNDVLESIKFFKDNKVDVPRFGMLAPYKGTPIYDWAKANGNILIDESSKLTHGLEHEEVHVAFDTKEFPAEERIKAFKLAEKESQYWAIRMRLGRVVSLPFKIEFIRRLAIKLLYSSSFLKRTIWD